MRRIYLVPVVPYIVTTLRTRHWSVVSISGNAHNTAAAAAAAAERDVTAAVYTEQWSTEQWHQLAQEPMLPTRAINFNYKPFNNLTKAVAIAVCAVAKGDDNFKLSMKKNSLNSEKHFPLCDACNRCCCFTSNKTLSSLS